MNQDDDDATQSMYGLHQCIMFVLSFGRKNLVIQEFRGQNVRKLVVMTVYQPIEKGGSQIGKITVEAQHASLLLKTRDALSKPRAAFRHDLLQCIQQYQQERFDLLVTGDFNEALGSERDGKSQIVSETSLLDLMAAHHSEPPPATYARGHKRLDYALASPKVLVALQSAGYEAFGNRTASDHRGYFFTSTQRHFLVPKLKSWLLGSVVHYQHEMRNK